jgi:putative aldouronate transport system substrate-binding protein
MQKLYKEGLLDNDFPVNTAGSAKEKFTNGTEMAYPVNFWDLDSIYKAFEAAGINTKVQAATFLAKDASTAPEHYISQGVGNVSFIPKTAKNPEHAIIWFNMLSDPANYRRIYIGEEGVSYELKDGKYYPIFPAPGRLRPWPKSTSR